MNEKAAASWEDGILAKLIGRFDGSTYVGRRLSTASTAQKEKVLYFLNDAEGGDKLVIWTMPVNC